MSKPRGKRVTLDLPYDEGLEYVITVLTAFHKEARQHNAHAYWLDDEDEGLEVHYTIPPTPEQIAEHERREVSDSAAAECGIEPGCWSTDLDAEHLNRYSDAVERRLMDN